MEITISSEKYGDHTVLIDDEDHELVSKYRWHLKPSKGKHSPRVRTSISGDQTTLMMHRLIMGLSKYDDLQVDHINGNGMDNRKCNLRTCTGSQNNANRKHLATGKTSKYRGVSLSKTDGKYTATIGYRGWTQGLGRFDTEEEAALAYNTAAIETYGEFASLNEISAHA